MHFSRLLWYSFELLVPLYIFSNLLFYFGTCLKKFQRYDIYTPNKWIIHKYLKYIWHFPLSRKGDIRDIWLPPGYCHLYPLNIPTFMTLSVYFANLPREREKKVIQLGFPDLYENAIYNLKRVSQKSKQMLIWKGYTMVIFKFPLYAPSAFIRLSKMCVMKHNNYPVGNFAKPSVSQAFLKPFDNFFRSFHSAFHQKATFEWLFYHSKSTFCSAFQKIENWS